MGSKLFPYPKAMLIIRFGANAVALRLSDNPYQADHGFHPWLSNSTAPQLRQLLWLCLLRVTTFLSWNLVRKGFFQVPSNRLTTATSTAKLLPTQ